MAKNYTMKEVAIGIATKDEMSIADFGKRFPLLTCKMAALVAKAPDETIDIFSNMPEYLTANKVNKIITTKSDEAEDADTSDETDEEVKEEPKKKAKAAKVAKTSDDEADEDEESEGGYESMGTKELYNLLGDKKLRKKCQEEFGGFKKSAMIACLNKYAGGEDAEEDVDEDDEDEAPDYHKMTAPALYALCKERKLKAEPKKNSKYYIGILEKADAEADAEEEEADDDWGDEADTTADESADDGWTDVEPKQKKKAGRPPKAKVEKAEKPAAKPKAKAAKKAEPEEDDDDDWDI